MGRFVDAFRRYPTKEKKVAYPFPATLPLRRESTTERLKQERQEIIHQTMPSTVSIGTQIEKADGRQGEGLGSGFVIAPGIIATNKHVVADAAAIEVQTSDMNRDGSLREKAIYAAEVAYVSPTHDIAFIRINPDEHPDMDLQPLDMGNSTGMKIGHPVMAIGAPYGLTGTYSEGGISRTEHVVLDGDGGEKVIEISANVRPGNSGGPVVDMADRDGRAPVVGIAVAQVKGESGLAFIIPINTVLAEFVQFQQQESLSQQAPLLAPAA